MGQKIGSIEVFKDHAGEFRFRVKSANNEVIVQSEGYTRKQNCLGGINSLADVMTDYAMDQVPIKEMD